MVSRGGQKLSSPISGGIEPPSLFSTLACGTSCFFNLDRLLVIRRGEASKGKKNVLQDKDRKEWVGENRKVS